MTHPPDIRASLERILDLSKPDPHASIDERLRRMVEIEQISRSVLYYCLDWRAGEE